MHALVTGASGFLGGRLVSILNERGVRVTVLARRSSVLRLPDGVGSARGEFDASLAAVLPTLPGLASVTHVFHCAGCSTDWAPSAEYRAANVDGVRAMLAAAPQLPRLERFLHVSSTDVYGYPATPGDETAPLHDTGLPYNATKIAGERLAWEAGAAGLPVTIVRPASIYGPGGKAFVTDVVTMLRQRLMLLVDGGRAPGGFVYVDDVCEGMVAAATLPQALGEAYNLGDAHRTTWRTYTDALARAIGAPSAWLQLPFPAALALARASELPHRLGIPGRPLLTRHATYLLARDQSYSIAKAQTHLGWQQRVDLAQGIAASAARA